MERHLIELSETYQLGVHDGGYMVYQLEQDGERFKRKKATKCATFDAAIEFLINCELQAEDLENVEQLKKTLNAIREEVSAAICKSQASFY
ncbi:hypothetical protein [Aggregatibacter actinomycetemcomitans]|uniref:hypothetical protein n=1 Tax=Aggregatibacter actinomycetemcomitans TaxID=714 RepID=UPI00197BA148|nr:hypothetical protein [Aggregatibacter actinomycetemcomitans]MBN6079920.1 hypothetical protein [Aggregatibacter actinomycetemcomitans]